MKTLSLDAASIDECIDEAQRGRIVITRNGEPVALMVGIDGLDEEQIALGADADFWKLIRKRRQEESLSRQELEARLSASE